jgi:hypothetical protein
VRVQDDGGASSGMVANNTEVQLAFHNMLQIFVDRQFDRRP